MSRQTDKIKDEIIFVGGLNSDDDPRFLPKGDYLDAVNIRTNEDGNGGIVVNVKGYESVYSPVYTQEIVCGKVYYPKNESVIMFIYYLNGATPGNKIVEYNPQTDTATVHINDTILGFVNPQTNDYFVDAGILGDWLAWTDNNNPIRMINLVDISGITDLTTYIDLHKIPPTATSVSKHVPPLVSMGYDSSKVVNNLSTGYQFKTRYIYSDFRPSTYSGTSDLAISSSLVRSQDGIVPLNSENYVNVQFNSSNNNVRYIDVVVREGNIGAWNRVVRIDKNDPENVYTTGGSHMTSALSDNTAYVYRFFNNEGRIPLVFEEVEKANDFIPDKAETLTFIGENNLVIGGGTEGKSADVPLNVSLTANDDVPEFIDDWVPSYTRGGLFVITFDWDDLFSTSRTSVLAGDYVYWNFNGQENHSGGTPLTYLLDEFVVFDKNYNSISDILGFLSNNTSLPSKAGYVTGTWSISVVSNTIKFTFTPASGTFTGSVSFDYATLVKSSAYSFSTQGFISDLSFKRNFEHKLALIYEDKYGNEWPPLTSDDTDISIESVASSGAGLAYIYYTISNEAPDGAVAYRWAYAYKPKTFLQTYITDVSYFEDPDGNINGKQIAIDISGNNQFLPDNYTVEVGDRIKIIKEGGSYTATGGFVDTAPEFIIRDIKGSIDDGTNVLTGTWLIIDPSNSDPGYKYVNVGSPSKFMNALIEIYKFNKEEVETRYYEIGSGGYCVGGTTTHQDWNTGAANGYINQGDVWYRPMTRYIRAGSGRTAISLVIDLFEDPYPYVDAGERINGIGGVRVEDELSQSEYRNILRYSNKFFEDTQVNGLSTFDGNSKKDVSSIYGNIKGLEQLGKSLVVICEKKVLSGGVGYTEYLDAQGQVTQVKSDAVIGFLRAHSEDYGTFIKESILNTGKYIYFFDLYNQAVVRKAPNGLYPISGEAISPEGITNYKMRTYFKQLSESLISSLSGGNPYDMKVYMGHDEYYHDIYITFKDDNTAANNVTLVFNETTKRWISKRTSYVSNESSTFYLSTRNKLLVAYNERLYLINSDIPDRCNIFGAAQNFSIKHPTFELTNIIKLYNYIRIHSNNQWKIEADDAIVTIGNDSYNEMSSKILSGNWHLEEGVYGAPFLRDMKTTSGSIKLHDLYTGDELRGYTLIIEMTNDATDITKLFKVELESEPSG
jgi:hypothetical protein